MSTFKTFILTISCAALPATLVFANAGQAFFGDPADEHHAWAVHDGNRPQPPTVKPGDQIGQPPSDAVVLFDGTEASFKNWRHMRENRKADWVVENGYLKGTGGAGYIATVEEFGDCQLHVEWSHEKQLPGTGQQRGNSGVFLMGICEVQVLDNYQNPTYSDGTAGAVYGVMPPAANALRPPGQWQSYDIIFRRPIVKDGQVIDPGSMTVLMNGVVVQDSTALEGGGGYRNRKALNREFPEKGPLTFQDHGNPIRFRNVWYRPLRKRGTDGGFGGRIPAESAVANRSQVAKDIRKDATGKQGVDKMLRLFESLCYMEHAATRKEAETMAGDYVSAMAGKPDRQLNSLKSELNGVHQAFKYMQKWKFIPADFAPAGELHKLMDAQGWLKKR